MGEEASFWGYYNIYYGSYLSNRYGVTDYDYYDSFYDEFYGLNYSQDAFSYQFEGGLEDGDLN